MDKTPPPPERRDDVVDLVKYAIDGKRAERRRIYRRNAEGQPAQTETLGDVAARMLGGLGRGGKS